MTLNEAIKINEQERTDHHSLRTDVIGQAQQLGIEALKRVQDIRSEKVTMISILLPGETTEE